MRDIIRLRRDCDLVVFTNYCSECISTRYDLMPWWWYGTPIKTWVCLDPFARGWSGGSTPCFLSILLFTYHLFPYFLLTLGIISNNNLSRKMGNNVICIVTTCIMCWPLHGYILCMPFGDHAYPRVCNNYRIRIMMLSNGFKWSSPNLMKFCGIWVILISFIRILLIIDSPKMS